MEITCTPRPKTLLHTHIFPVWEGKLWDLRALTPKSSLQGKPLYSGDLNQLYTFI